MSEIMEKLHVALKRVTNTTLFYNYIPPVFFFFTLYIYGVVTFQQLDDYDEEFEKGRNKLLTRGGEEEAMLRVTNVIIHK